MGSCMNKDGKNIAKSSIKHHENNNQNQYK
jgi:hypothetical protein